MTRFVLTLLIGLVVSLGTSAAFAETFECKRHTKAHTEFKTQSDFELWFPKEISLEIYNWQSREGYKSLKKVEKQIQYLLLPNGKMIASLVKYSDSLGKALIFRKPGFGGFREVSRIRYECNRTSLQLVVGLKKEHEEESKVKITENTDNTSNKVKQNRIISENLVVQSDLTMSLTSGVKIKRIGQKIVQSKSEFIANLYDAILLNKPKLLMLLEENNRERFVVEDVESLRKIFEGDLATLAKVKEAPGLNTQTASSSSSATNLGNYKNKEICRFAVNGADWRKKSFYQQYVKEAKRRGLSCGVGETTQTASVSVPTDSGVVKSDLPECLSSTDKNRCFGTFTQPDGIKYVGEFKDSMYQGQGTMTWPDGMKYVGEFKDGKPHGQGTHTRPDGQKYVGEVRDGLENGQGTLTWPDGEKYVGEFTDGQPHGQGTHTWPDGKKYVGEFTDGQPHGQGTHTWPDGQKYVGEVKDGKLHGHGTMTSSDGEKYVGEFKDNMANGQGTYTRPDGEKYVGEFKDDLFHGQGTLTWPDGEKYVGEFKDDMANGQGTNTWPDGQKYVGEFKDDLFHGHGTMTWPDGQKYVGEFKDDKKHGPGTMTLANGTKAVGEWKDDRFQKFTEMTDADIEVLQKQIDKEVDRLRQASNSLEKQQKQNKQTTSNDTTIGNSVAELARQVVTDRNQGVWFPTDKPNCEVWNPNPQTDETVLWSGECLNGKAHGWGFTTWKWKENGEFVTRLIEGERKDGRKIGKVTIRYENGEMYFGSLNANGHREGEGTSVLSDGRKYVGEYKDGLANGRGTMTLPDGGKYVGEYKDGKVHGHGTMTWPNGKKYVGEFKDDEANGHGTMTSSDGKKYVGEFKDDLFHGQGTMNLPNGGKYVGGYKDGKKDGQGTLTWPDGMKYVGGYRDGKWHGQGTMTLSDGLKHSGEFKDGNFHGQGTTTLPDGLSYVGEWTKNGQGSFTLPDGKKYVGEYEDGFWQGRLQMIRGKYEKAAMTLSEFNSKYPHDPRIIHTTIWIAEAVSHFAPQDEACEIYGALPKLLDNPPESFMARLGNLKSESECGKTVIASSKRVAKKQTTTNDTTLPTITIASVNTKGKLGFVKGRVNDNTGIAEVTVDGTVVPVKSNGDFEYETHVPIGGLSLEVQATDLAGLSSMMSVTLEREAGTATAAIKFDRLNPLGKRVKINKDALALIVGVANYENTPAKAVFADSDARMFHDYASEKLGIPESRIKTLVNDGADERELLLSVKSWLTRASKQGKSDVYVFFAGHGLASDDGKKMYLLPYDGAPELLEKTAISRQELFDDIAAANPRSVTVFLDTCYSGTTRGTDTLIASRPVVIHALEQSVPDNFTVFTAAAGDQTAKPLEEAKHGMFSYFLMKGMEGEADKNQDNKITAGELHNYVKSHVVHQSSGSQTPDFDGDAERVLVRFQ